MEVSETTVDDHLASFEDEAVATTMREVDDLVVAAMPGRRRVLYEGRFWGGTDQTIIGYGLIIQPRPKGEQVHWFLVGLARQKKHYSLYVNAVSNGAYLGQRYADRLGKVRVGSASIGFTSITDLDLDVLDELLAEAHASTPPDPD